MSEPTRREVILELARRTIDQDLAAALTVVEDRLCRDATTEAVIAIMQALTAERRSLSQCVCLDEGSRRCPSAALPSETRCAAHQAAHDAWQEQHGEDDE